MQVESEILRSLLYGIYRAYSRLHVFDPPPRLVVNSLPKAGTHLLRRLLGMAPRFRYSGLHIANRRFLLDLDTAQNPKTEPLFDLDRLEKTLDATRQGQFVTTHFYFQSELESMFDRLGFKRIMLLRDPRDLVVSHARYVTTLRRNILHRRYTSELNDDDARLMASIRGLPSVDGEPGLIDIGLRLRRFQPWLDRDNTLVCRFESLVGPKGGGNRDAQLRAIDAIFRFIDRSVPEDRLAAVADRVWSPGSATFRKGMIGDWRNHFTLAHVESFKEVAGEALIQLGYENGRDW